jgi:WD40 repeat protein
VFDLQWCNNDTQLITAGADRYCTLMDIEKQTVVSKVQDHIGSLKCIAISQEGSIIATGGRDGKIFFYDPRSLVKPIGDYMFT